MKKVSFYTLGCKLNFSETSTLSRMFEERGFKKVEFEEGADIYVINTCSVTDHADKKCKKIVREAQRFSDNPYIIITGCYAQLKPAEIAGIPGVSMVLGAAEKLRLFDYIDGFVKRESAEIHRSPISDASLFNKSYSLNDRTRTFLKVQDGCDYSCSFCTIPMARGKSRSDTIENIIQAAREIASQDIKEIVLTGVNTGDFGIMNGEREKHFIDLIRELDRVKGIRRFRISSIEPNLLTDEIINFVRNSEKFVPHFHIPLQSGSNRILKLMRRRYLRELYADRIRSVRENIPYACIGADVITGFPGETDEDFLDTHDFIKGLEISYLHVFPYSERAGTIAESMEGRLPHRTRHERCDILRGISVKKRREFYESNLGRTAEVLFEADIDNGKMYGFTENYIRTEAKYDPALVNEVKKVSLKRIGDSGFVEIEEPHKVPAAG